MDKDFEISFAALPAEFRRKEIPLGLVLGSGWNQVLERFEPLARLSFADIPGLDASTVKGHTGEVLLFEHKRTRIIAFSGRRHWYEGVGWGPVVTPIELMRRLGVSRILLTNAVGTINHELRPGDFMLVADHISLQGLNPLQGPMREGWGTRFPDQSMVYSPELRGLMAAAATSIGIDLRSGVYVFTAGPCFETPAEVRAYRGLGGDVVGMSTVPESIVANAMGIEVAALSCVTNLAAGIGDDPLAHEEVLELSRKVTPTMQKLLARIIDALV